MDKKKMVEVADDLHCLLMQERARSGRTVKGQVDEILRLRLVV
jgi:hypothetical protein